MKRTRIATLLLSIMLIVLLILPSCTVFGPKESKPVEPEQIETEQVESEQPETVEEPAPETTEEKQGAQSRAQDDFYDHVNGELIKEKSKENDGMGWDQFGQLSDRVKADLETIQEDVTKDGVKHEDGSAEKTVSDLYKTAQDKEAREKAGLGSLEEYLKELNEADSITSYLKTLAKIRKDLGKTSLLGFHPIPNPQDSSKYALYLQEPEMLLGKEDLGDEGAVGDLKTYIKNLLTQYGLPEQETDQWADKLVSFIKEIGNQAYTKKEHANVKLTMNSTSVEELQEKLSNVNLSEYLQESGQDQFGAWVLQNPKMLSLINDYLKEEHLELLKKYSTVVLLNDFAPYLTEGYDKAYATFNQIEDMSEKEVVWDRTQLLAEKEVGELYAKKTFSSEKKEAVTSLVHEILAAYKKNLDKLDWLSEESREEAKKKIDTMSVKIGYPEEYTSFVKGVVQSPEDGGSFIENAIKISKAQAEADLSMATEEVDRSEWGLSPQTINAYYDPAMNEIIFPGAMLQAPFYNEKGSRAENLGAIGAVIAHEITHAFDDLGSLYDDQGNLRDWWTKEDRQAFTQRAEQFKKHFGAIEVLPRHKVDGELTLGENIADTGAISVISSMLENDPEALKEMFTSYARVWASVSGEDELKDQLIHDEHAPAKVRVNAVLSLTDAFYKAFDVKPEDKMYVAPENRVKMF